MAKPLFIVIDGIDGSGKGAIMAMLYSYLSSLKKYRVLTTAEPTSNKYGKKIRQILRKEKEPMKNAEKLLGLYLKDRALHLKEVIEPFLKIDNSIVACDRYYYSTIAYQNAQGIPLKALIKANKPFRKPDIAFILDLPPKTALERISKIRQKEKFEKLSFMLRVRENFLALRKHLKDNIKVIDASKSKNQVFSQIKGELNKLL